MHLKSLIAILGLASTALADCYTFGRKSNYRLPDKNVLDIPEICRKHFMGDYAAGETKSLCYGGMERRVSLNVLPCLFQMGDMLRHCEFGGHSKEGNWYYRVDPNVNACGEPTSG